LRVVVTKHEQPSMRHEWRFHHLTDCHLDNLSHAAEAFDARLKEIADDPYALWSGGGDYADLILPGDKRWRAGGQEGEWRDHQDRIPDLYIERVCEKFAPIKDKCVSLGVGNHETAVGEQFHRAVVGEVAAKLGITDRYVGYQGWAVMQFRIGSRLQSVKLYQYHGWSGGRLKGRKALQAERDIGSWDADIIALGHDHQPYGDVWYTDGLAYATKSGEYLPRRRARCVVNGGAWLSNDFLDEPLRADRGWDAPNISWSEKKNYRPEGVGGPVVRMMIDMGRAASDGPGRPTGLEFLIEKRSSGWNS
jgi:hypothetical protein